MESFPTYILKDGQTILDLFCAAFYGDHTLPFITKFNVDYIGIDTDTEKLMVMQWLFPNYQFYPRDVYELINETGYTYDIVISDQWTNQNDKIIKVLDKLCKLSKEWLLVSTNLEFITKMPLEIGGFSLVMFHLRSYYLNGTYWAVYKKN